MRHTHRVLSIAIATLAALGTASGQNPVVEWNNTGITTALAASQGTAPGSNTQPGSILYLTYMHLAIYDAVNAIDHRFQSYGPEIFAPPDASKEAAVTEAAYRTLAQLFPDQVSSLTTLYNAALAAIPDSIAKMSGMQSGLAAANSILSLRSGDGRGAVVPYTWPSVPTSGRLDSDAARVCRSGIAVAQQNGSLHDEQRLGAPPGTSVPADEPGLGRRL